MLEIVAEVVIGRIVERAIDRLGRKVKALPRDQPNVSVHRDRSTLHDHVAMVNRWAAEISFRELSKSKALRESFVDLDLHLGIRSHSSVDAVSAHRVSDLIDLPGHYVLLGDPGAGKTTSLKQVAMKVFERLTTQPSEPVPLLIRLREFKNNESLFATILTSLGISLEINTPTDEKAAIEERIVIQTVESLACVILIDGLDELQREARDAVIRELRVLLLRLQDARVLLTCRTGDFIYHLENSQVLTLNPLTDAQVRQFTIRWLGAAKAPDFLHKIRTNPYSGTEIRPLTLAHLCAIYEKSGSIPEKPRTVYRKIVRLLLEEWDEQRSVKRSSKYANFEIDRKEDFLQAIAYQITILYHRPNFSHYELEHVYYEVNGAFGLPRAQAGGVVREIESHTGLLVETANDMYEFAHKAIHEYLTAAYITKLPAIPQDNLISLPHEMALTVALSSDPTAYYCAVVRKVVSIKSGTLQTFVDPFLSRLISEKVDLAYDWRLGALTAILFSETYFPQEFRYAFPAQETVSDAFKAFLRLGLIKRSVKEALDNASWKIRMTDKDRFLFKMASLPLEITALRSGRVIDNRLYIILNEQFISAVGVSAGLPHLPSSTPGIQFGIEE